MTTPVHLLFDLCVYGFADKTNIVSVSNIDLWLLFSSELIDLDHLFSKPIYHPKRNPFKTHFLHKNWRAVIIAALVFILYRPILFLGIGLLAHLFLDYCYIKMHRLED